MFDRVMVALDGSEVAERALATAEELARRLGAPLHLIRVADPTWLRFGANEAALEYAALGDAFADEEREAAAYLERTRAGLKERGVDATTDVRRGAAAVELAAVTGPSDLLVMASHGRGGPARWLLGSVAEDVTRHARGPVLLVRGVEEGSQASGIGRR